MRIHNKSLIVRDDQGADSEGYLSLDHSSEEEEEEDEAARAVRTILGQEAANGTSAAESAAIDGSTLSPEISRSGESNKENQHYLRSSPESNLGLPESLQQTVKSFWRMI